MIAHLYSNIGSFPQLVGHSQQKQPFAKLQLQLLRVLVWSGPLVAMGDYTAANLLSSRFGTGDLGQTSHVKG